MAHLAIYREKTPVSEVSLSGTDIFTIGRAQTNDIVLADPRRKVSRFHAALVRIPGPPNRYFVRDLGSRYTTRVCGQMIYQSLLEDGDIIGICDYNLVYSEYTETTRKSGCLRIVPNKVKFPTVEGSTVDFGSLGIADQVAISRDAKELIEHVRRETHPTHNLESYLAGLMPALASVVRAERGFIRLLLEDSNNPYMDIGLVGLERMDQVEISDPFFMDQLAQNRPVCEDRTVLGPVIFAQRMIGFVCVDRSRNSSPFTTQDIDFLLLFGRTVAAKFEDAETRPHVVPPEAAFDWPIGLIGKSKPMRKLSEQILRAASDPSNVLILGETGTGKELVAQAIHQASGRKGDLSAHNCAQLTESLAESEVFGYVSNSGIAGSDSRGAPGWFELAHGGTLFLDEVLTLTPVMQDKFLRVLQEKKVWRIGGRSAVEVDVKVAAATDQDVQKALVEGKLREPLYYRFGQHVHVLPLRERKEDIPLLAYYFVDRYAKLHRSPMRSISHRAMTCLLNYNWPGNVRELENCIRNAVLEDKAVMFSWDLPLHILKAIGSETVTAHTDAQSSSRKQQNSLAYKTMEEVEKEKIMEVLEGTRGNVTRAAKLLAVSRMTIINKMDKYEIPRNYGDPQYE